MKPFLILFIIVSWSALWADDGIDKAKQLLTDSKPIPSGILGAYDEQSADGLLYKAQMDALGVLAASSSAQSMAGMTPILIPFLNYTPSLTDAMIGGGFAPPSVETISFTWPAFKLILEIPDSSKDLREYASNKSNLLSLRLACVLLLQYKDMALFEESVKLLHSEFPDATPKFKKYLESVEAGQVYFWGAPQIKPTVSLFEPRP